jgi:DNA-binding response OmpR family regulator
MNQDSLNNKILIVDDDKFLIDMYSIKFNENKFVVETATNGEEALKKIDEGFVPDICLVDIIMPGMDGFELIAELKKRATLAKAAIIVLSNLGQQDDVTKGMSLGADGYIIKASATPTEVVVKVSDIVANKKY